MAKRYIFLLFVLIVLMVFGGCNSSDLDDTIETTTNTEMSEIIQTTETVEITETTQSVAELAAEAKRKRANTINYLQILNAVKNDRNIYKVRYPECYFAFDKDDMVCKRIELRKQIDTNVVSDEDFEYILNYIENIPSSFGDDVEGTESFIINFSYYDEEGNLQNKSISGYNQLPDGWADFISCVNYLCGGDYLSGEGEVIGVTPELLMEIFDVEDEDLVGFTLEELIMTNQLDMNNITSGDFDMNEQIDKYYDTTLLSIDNHHLSYEIKIVDSTQEEYDAFVEAFLEELGDDWEEGSNGFGQFRYLWDVSYGQLLIGRSADLDNMQITEIDNFYYIIMIKGEFECKYPFFYSKDGKFILIDYSGYYKEHKGIFLKFVELEY